MDYDDALNRGLERSPDIEETGSRDEVPDASVRPEGNVTVYENFQDTCDALGREDDHVMQFLQNEIGTSGHIDESGRARLTGEFSERRVSNAVDEYADEFVVCPECGLPDTHIEQEDGVEFLRCEACGARSATANE